MGEIKNYFNNKDLDCNYEQKESLYDILASSKDINELSLRVILEILESKKLKTFWILFLKIRIKRNKTNICFKLKMSILLKTLRSKILQQIILSYLPMVRKIFKNMTSIKRIIQQMNIQRLENNLQQKYLMKRTYLNFQNFQFALLLQIKIHIMQIEFFKFTSGNEG
ncbi:unnamed protein product [Paramecium octaurelia]|uniref:Uncharacterized protein n=1 Tax=Paramecium octaurelia TaxID=43137 RepID=A0A8S1VRB3_PAROT|nr:unnamed protein product [Paramecium octaurelia]